MSGPMTGAVSTQRALLTTIFTLQFLVALDMSLVNIALPEIRADLGFTSTGLQWVVNAYLLTFAGFMLLGGRLGDLWGRRPVVIGALTVFALASAVGGAATDSTVLIVARAIQGVAAAFLAPASLALASTVSDPAAHKRAMALWAGAGAAGGAVGVVLSGLLTDWFSWRAVMFVNIPIVVIGLVAALAGVRSRETRGTGQLDVAGAILVTTGVAALVYAVSIGGDQGWSSARAVVGFALAALLLLAFCVVEMRSTHPLMPPHLMMTRSILGANIFGFMLAAGQLAAFYFASLYVQTVWEVSSDLAGVLFVPFSFSVVIGVVLGGKLAAVIGARNAIALLGLVAAVGLFLFSRMPAHFDFWLGILVPSMITAIGVGGSMVLVGTVGTAGVDPAQAGTVSGILNSSRQLGGTIGLAILVTISAHYAAPVDGLRAGFAVGAVFLAVGALLSWLVLPRDSRRQLVAAAKT